MTPEENNTGGAASAASAPVITPATEAAAPAVTTSPAPSQTADSTSVTSATPATPAASAVPATETPKNDAPAQSGTTESPKVESTILGAEPPKKGDASKTEPVKTTETKSEGEKPTDQPKAEGSPSDKPAPLPAYEKFTLPDGVQVDEKKLGEFTKDLGEFQVLTKIDQGEMQKFGQKLMNRYVAETQETVKRISDYYTTTWEKTKNEMREQFVKDPELGGNRQQTTAQTVQEFVGEFGGSQEQIAELRKYMDTGIGNKLELIRLMNNAATTIKDLRMKYESEAGTRPLPGQKPVAERKSKTQTLYGKSSAGM